MTDTFHIITSSASSAFAPFHISRHVREADDAFWKNLSLFVRYH
jgi:hypothetical protein